MYLIGTMYLNLKTTWLLPVMLFILCWTMQVQAFDRELTPEEVAKLESNATEDSKNVVARRFLIEHYARLEMWNKVAEYSQGILSSLPPAQLLKVTNAYLENEDGEAATAAIGAYHGKAPASAASKTYEGLALAKVAKKEYKESLRKQKAIAALEVFKEAINQWPKETAPYLGWIATLNDIWPTNPDDILQVYKKLENATNDYESYLIEKCDLFVRASLWDQALVNCERSVKKHPADVDSLINLARAQKVKKDVEVAKATLLQVIQSHPSAESAHIVLAEIYMDESNFISASEQYREAISVEPNDDDAFLGLAKAEFQLKRYEEALSAYKNNCRLSRTVASEFKSAEGQLRISNNPLHIKYKNVMSSCR